MARLVIFYLFTVGRERVCKLIRLCATQSNFQQIIISNRVIVIITHNVKNMYNVCALSKNLLVELAVI